VSHGENHGGVVHQLAQGVGHDARLHLGALFRLLGAAAEKFKGEAVFNNHLIAAPGERHLYGKGGELEQVVIGVRILSDSNADGCGDAVRADNIVHGVKQGKLSLREGRKLLFLKQEEVTVPVVFA
jgi:hypothetical protein